MKRTMFVLMSALFLIALCSAWLYGADKNNPSKGATSVAAGKDTGKSEPQQPKTLTRAEQMDALISAHQWLSSLDNNGIPVMLDGILYQGTKGGDRVEDSYRFMEINKDAFGLVNPRQELKLEGVIGPDNIMPEVTVIFDQVVNGVKVQNGGYAFHFRPDGSMSSPDGQIDPEARKVDTNPAISEEQAKQIAFNDTLNANTEAEAVKMELLIGRFVDGPHLIWSFYVNNHSRSWSYIIDAKTGKILETRDSDIY